MKVFVCKAFIYVVTYTCFWTMVLNYYMNVTVCVYAHMRTHKTSRIVCETKVYLDPGSQLLCVLMETLVIVTTAHIFLPNVHLESVRTPWNKKGHGKGQIPLAVSGISILPYGTYS